MEAETPNGESSEYDASCIMQNIQAKDSSTQSNYKVQELTPTERVAKMKEEAKLKGIKGMRFQKTKE